MTSLSTPDANTSWVRKLFTARTGPWSWAQVGLGFSTSLLIIGIIKDESAGAIAFNIVAAAVGVTVVALLWKD